MVADVCGLAADGEMDWCQAMDRYLQCVGDRKKGLVPMRTVHRKTGTTRFWCVVYKSGATDPGVALNVCPWCEQRLDAAFRGGA